MLSGDVFNRSPIEYKTARGSVSGLSTRDANLWRKETRDLLHHNFGKHCQIFLRGEGGGGPWDQCNKEYGQGQG